MQRYALVVGISEYDDSNLGSLSRTVGDADTVAQLLQEFGGYRITKLTKRVIRSQLVAALKQLLQQQGEAQDVLIYYTGHGLTVIDPDDDSHEGYLAASDCTITVEDGKAIDQSNG